MSPDITSKVNAAIMSADLDKFSALIKASDPIDVMNYVPLIKANPSFAFKTIG